MSRYSDLLSRARVLARVRLSDELYEHCERVAATARALAERHGVDPEAAELAGLLHDYCRDDSVDDLLAAAAAAEETGLPVPSFERDHPYLLHARVAAARLRDELPGTGEAVLSAVAAHTVGAMPMSDLDRVVYVADMIEPARDFPGVEDLRTACGTEGLAECFRRGYGCTLRHVMEQGGPIHPVSAAVMVSIERETGRPLFDLTAAVS